MAIRPLKDLLSDALTKNSGDAYRQDIYYLAERTFGLTFEDIFLKREESVEDSLFLNRLNRYQQGEPLYYILGSAPFFKRDFLVDKRVLIPRNETEELVSEVIETIGKSGLRQPKIIDVGTGSGCIAITMSLEISDAYVEGVDISSDALTLAKENNERLGGNVSFYRSDCLEEAIRNKKKFDVLVSNPPYIDPNAFVDKSVLDFEPKLALFAEERGLAVYRKIFSQMPEVMNEKALAFFEISPEQETSLSEMIKKELLDYEYRFKRDINGHKRFLLLKKGL